MGYAERMNKLARAVELNTAAPENPKPVHPSEAQTILKPGDAVEFGLASGNVTATHLVVSRIRMMPDGRTVIILDRDENYPLPDKLIGASYSLRVVPKLMRGLGQ